MARQRSMLPIKNWRWMSSFRTRTPAPINYLAPSTAVPFGTSHMYGQATGGAYVLYLDNHVEWRAFDEKNAVAVRQPGGGILVSQSVTANRTRRVKQGGAVEMNHGRSRRR